MWKRNQSMMAELAKCDFVNKVIFVNPLASIRGLFLHKKSNLNPTSCKTSKLFPARISSKLLVYTPLNILPNRKWLSVLKRIETIIMLKIIKRLNSGMPYILFMNCPNIFSNDLLDELLKDTKLSIFDFSDDFVELGYGKKTIELFKRNTTKYAQAADIVLTVNELVRNKYGYLNTNIRVIRNATNYYNFDRKDYNSIDFLEKIKKNKKSIIGYSGIANISRIDTDLFDFLLERRPDWQFVFIGPADPKFTGRYSQHKNIHHLSPVDYQILPDYIRYFDVAVVPFKINEHTKGNDLLKFHDFLAMGKPVVSTEIGGANDLKDVISIAKSPADFLEAIEKSLNSGTGEDILKRKNISLKNSWHNRIKELEKIIRSSLEI